MASQQMVSCQLLSAESGTALREDAADVCEQPHIDHTPAVNTALPPIAVLQQAVPGLHMCSCSSTGQWQPCVVVLLHPGFPH